MSDDKFYVISEKFKITNQDKDMTYLENANREFERHALPTSEFRKRYKVVTDVEEFKTVTDYCGEAYNIASKNGFHNEYKPISVSLALIHSEVSEALEADRNGDSDNFIEELADICIRVFDLCGELGIDLEHAIEQKMEHNKTREYKHGKRY